MKQQPLNQSFTRRDVLKIGAIATSGFVLGTLGLVPKEAQAYPFSLRVLKPSDFIELSDMFPVEIISDLCLASGPNTVTFSGNADAYKGSNKSGSLWGVKNGSTPGDLTVKATYDRVGVHRENGREVGCRVTVSNLSPGLDFDRNIAVSNRNANCIGVGFLNFDLYTHAIYFVGCESGDISEEFFYCDTKEVVSAEGTLVTLASLDSFYNDGWKKYLREGTQLPDDVTEVYTTEDSLVTVDSTLTLSNTYEHACYGDGNIRDQFSDEYDFYNVGKHGITWRCTTPDVRYKLLSNTTYVGFNIQTTPIVGIKPNAPVKKYAIGA